jgi:class 3 adenylate cyclase
MRPRAIVLDDDPIARGVIGEALGAAGFEVTGVSDAGTAFSSVAVAGAPELFVVDFVLPGMSGLDVVKGLRDDPRSADAAIVFVTAVMERAPAVAALQLGADDALWKPVDPVELGLRCRKAVERRVGTLDETHERRDIAVVFADVRGFTPLTERIDPETGITVMNALFDALDRAVVAEGGWADKFMGDSLLALFGARGLTEGNEARACRAALAMQVAARRCAEDSLSLAEHRATFGIGVGVTCGQAVLGALGSRKKRSFTAIGDPVNLAARLQGVAERDEIILDADVAARLGGLVKLSPPRQVEVKGKDLPRTVYRLLGFEKEAGTAA